MSCVFMLLQYTVHAALRLSAAIEPQRANAATLTAI
jgi:hypothetical protein